MFVAFEIISILCSSFSSDINSLLTSSVSLSLLISAVSLFLNPMGDSSIEPFDEAFEDTQSRRSIGESIKKILMTNPRNEKKRSEFLYVIYFRFLRHNAKRVKMPILLNKISTKGGRGVKKVQNLVYVE